MLVLHEDLFQKICDSFVPHFVTPPLCWPLHRWLNRANYYLVLIRYLCLLSPSLPLYSELHVVISINVLIFLMRLRVYFLFHKIWIQICYSTSWYSFLRFVVSYDVIDAVTWSVISARKYFNNSYLHCFKYFFVPVCLY